MFRKLLKTKSNTQLKGSERKSVKDNFLRSFPNLTESDVENLLPKKEGVFCIKLSTSTEEIIQVFFVQKCPLAFEFRETLFPSIYLLWKFPNLLPSFTIHNRVLSFLTSGADLMLPGTITPPSKYPNLPEGAVACINLAYNKAAVGVGVTAISSAEMAAAGGRGKCLTMYHLYGDKLCAMNTPRIPMPQLGPPEWLTLSNYDEDFPALGVGPLPELDVNDVAAAEPTPEASDAPLQEEASGKPAPVTLSPEEMDDLLIYCFFLCIKYSKTLTLPILTSNFYKLQMIPVCPEGKTLDIKKSTFKKLKPFLDGMCKEGIITVTEAKKGVESIVGINKDHPKFTEFYVEPSLRPRKVEEGATNQPSTSVTESYIITPNVLPIFQDAGYNKGDTVQIPEIRQNVVGYVKKHDCQVEENKRLVAPKEALVKICKTENCLTWEELMEKVCESMKSCYKVSSGADEIVAMGKVSPITITVSQRSGNKKVTLIDNLELFGIRIPEFAKECQHGVAASTSTSRPPGKKCDQLLVQGNQVLFVHNLLTEKYKVPTKYIRGLENAPKKKN